jgi:hypothetical protein
MTAAERTSPSRVTWNSPARREPNVGRLTPRELEEELTIAAMATGRLRWRRYTALLAERARRAG